MILNLNICVNAVKYFAKNYDLKNFSDKMYDIRKIWREKLANRNSPESMQP